LFYKHLAQERSCSKGVRHENKIQPAGENLLMVKNKALKDLLLAGNF
jgi:hypothetical protein